MGQKAFQSLLDRVRGHHVQWSTVAKWSDRPSKSSRWSASSTWAPEKDELMEGIAYINGNAPESDAHNEQHPNWMARDQGEDHGAEQVQGLERCDFAARVSSDNFLLEALHVRYFAPNALSFVCLLWCHDARMAGGDGLDISCGAKTVA